jgi:hypothetical protein
MTKRFLFHSCIVVIFSAFFVQAETKLPSILGSHMVLQQGEKCPIWGWDETGISHPAAAPCGCRGLKEASFRPEQKKPRK